MPRKYVDNELQFLFPNGAVILVDAPLMYVAAVQLGIKLIDDAMEHLHYNLGILPFTVTRDEITAVREAISMLEEIRMRLAREYDDARASYAS